MHDIPDTHNIHDICNSSSNSDNKTDSKCGRSKGKVLIISYYFPPIQQIGGLRIANMAKELLRMGYDVRILASRGIGQPIDNAFEDIRQLDEKVVRITNSDVYLIYRMFCLLRSFIEGFIGTLIKIIKQKRNKIDNRVPDRGVARDIERAKSSLIGRFFLRLLSYFPFNCLFHHGGVLYIVSCILIAFRERKDVVAFISSYPPLVNHLIGFVFKIILPKGKWIMDFRDLPGGDIEERADWTNEFIVGVFAKKADAIVTVSQGFADALKRYGRSPYVVINGISYEDYLDAAARIKRIKDGKEERQERFRITYTGRLYGTYRNPEIVFSSIRELILEGSLKKEDLEIVYAGPNSDIWRGFLGKELPGYTFVDKGNLSRKDAILLQRSSCINLMLTWANPAVKGVLTGKLQEYLLALRPILCVIEGAEDKEIEEIIERLKCGLFVYNGRAISKNICKRYILDLYGRWRNGECIFADIDFIELERLTYRYQLKSFVSEVIA